MRKHILFVIVLFFYNLNTFSQFSDCSGAIPVCETGNQNHQVNGIGTDDFNGNIQSGCLKTQNGSTVNTIERNSIWFRYKAARSGQLGFNIIPGDPDEDWDFAVYGPNPTCGNLGEPVGGTCDSGTSISNYFSINPNDRGQTGAGKPPSPESADWYSPFINVIEGEEYLLLINSFEGSNNSFTLEWTGDLVNDGLGNPLDCSIVSGDLGFDQTVCEGTSITLDGTPENTNPPVDTYEWQIDTGSGFNTLTNETNPELNITNNISGTYKVIVTDTDGNSGEDEVVITFLPPPTATQPGDVNSCDTDKDGSTSLDFQTDVTPSILNGQDQSEVKVSYYLSEMDAENNTNILPNPYVLNTFTKSKIWARVFNVALTDDLNCDNITSFNITFAESPTPQTPTDYKECDDTDSGDDTDGLFTNFLLKTKDTEILGNLDPSVFSVSYHTTANGAQTSATTNAIDKNVNYTNTTKDLQPIYVRVENVNYTGCFDASKSFNLEVVPLPVLKTNVTLKQCDDDTDGYSNFNLTEANSLISENSTEETFTYYPTLADANSNTNSISEDTTYQNQTAGTQTIAAKVTNNNTGCFKTTELQLTISTTQIPSNYQRNFNSCDDFLDTDGNNNVNNNDTDGISSFDFSSAKTEVEAFFSSSGQTVTATFYRNEADALAEENVITDISNYRNIGYPNTQQIYVRADSDLKNDCLGLGPHVTLTVDPLPDFKVTSPQIICLNTPPHVLRVENPNETYTYQWKDANGHNLGNKETQEVNTGGDYTITATKTDGTNCYKTKTITVNESIIASITIADVTIIDDSDNNSIIINNTDDNLGIGDYEFALLNESGSIIKPYQNEPFFEQLTGGIYTIAVRDKNSCGTATLTVPILEFPKFFTPNGDGIKDIWFIKGATTDFFPKSSIHIFNRYGKILVKIPLGYGWNGVFNSKKLPSNDYWYSIQLEDKDGNIRNKTGHFTLLRH